MNDWSLQAAYCILLVEDDELQRSTQATYFTDLGYRVLEAGDVEQAHRLMADNSTIALVLTDINLCGRQTGEDLAESLATAQPMLPVILTSALGLRRPLKGRLHRFVAKPCSLQRVAALVHHLLSRVGSFKPD